MMDVISNARGFENRTAEPDIESLVAAARRAGRKALDEGSGKRLLRLCSIDVPSSVIVADAVEGAKAAAQLRPPFVVKVVSPDILHKSDVGGVALGLTDGDGVSAAIERMLAIPAIADARRDGFLIEEMSPAGLELVIGAVRDTQFGPLVMVGLGGVFVEVLADVAFRICPLSKADAHAMLDELRGARMLDGARGAAPVSRDAIVDVLMRLGGPDGLLVAHGQDFDEIDLNPVIVGSSWAIAVDARFILSNADEIRSRPSRARGEVPILERFRPLFCPRSVAVVGASATSTNAANTFIQRMKAFGYSGNIYPIHPKAGEIEGLKAFPDLDAVPEAVDYAYVAIGASKVAEAITAAPGRLKMAQVISSGFGETEEGRKLESDLVAEANAAGVRILGPNCLGTYSPAGGLTFPANAPREPGPIGIISQSGGLTTDIIKRGQWRGLRFSGAVTIGNSADVSPTELAEYYFADPGTKAVGIYLEDVKDGRAFFELLRNSPSAKPVVLMKGGRSALGRLAASSHTGALAGDEKVWNALCRQTGTIMVDMVDDFLDALAALQFLELRPSPTKKVVLFGNGGGTSVLATDYFASRGLEILPFPSAVRKRLEEIGLPPGTSLANPIDAPVRSMQQENGKAAERVLDIVCAGVEPDAVVMHLNLAAFIGRGPVDPLDNLVQAIVNVKRRSSAGTHFLLVLRSDGSEQIDNQRRHYREKAQALGVPVFDEMANAATALTALNHFENHFANRLRHEVAR